MKLPEIKRLVEEINLIDLENAELALLEEQQPTFIVNGDDEGEKLTHVMAAIWIKKDMEKNGNDFRTSMRNFSQKVRTSIS